MSEMTLDATVREGTGKGVARKLRRSGSVPAVIYGLSDPLHIQVDMHKATRLVNRLHGSERMVTLKVVDAKSGKPQDKHVLLKNVQATPVAHHLLHLDFLEVNVREKVQVEVEVVSVGEPQGEREGGTLQIVSRQVSVECLPGNIPESIEVDVSEMGVGDSIHASDIKLPPGVELLTDPDETLFTMAGAMREEAAEEEEAAEAGEEGEAATAEEEE